MEKTIAALRGALKSKLDELALIHGEEAELDQEDQDEVSQDIDEINETWNENLPSRPHS